MLGSTPFLIYIDDLPDCIRIDCSIFADDSTVYDKGEANNQDSRLEPQGRLEEGCLVGLDMGYALQ